MSIWLAQWLGRWLGDAEVKGSIPRFGTKFSFFGEDGLKEKKRQSNRRTLKNEIT